MDIGTQLRNLIEQEGITQKQLAGELNISTTTLNGYIQNRRQPDARMAIRLAAYFNTTLDYIYGLTTLREPPVSPYNAQERMLVDIYRGLPDEWKTLYVATGRAFVKVGRKLGQRQEINECHKAIAGTNDFKK
ncbi:MAG: helix-turn-helix domain-containing protein [Roseburia sp.]|nr:helix-turn-helix domain-containing protein [Roseburia sp.]